MKDPIVHSREGTLYIVTTPGKQNNYGNYKLTWLCRSTVHKFNCMTAVFDTTLKNFENHFTSKLCGYVVTFLCKNQIKSKFLHS